MRALDDPISDPPLQQLTIRAFIDGADTLHVRGRNVWFVHRDKSLPGHWTGKPNLSRNEPTYINGKAWTPQWHQTDDSTLRSYPLEAGYTLVPIDGAAISMETAHARGRVAIISRPTEADDYTLSLLFDDLDERGAVWYEVRLGW